VLLKLLGGRELGASEEIKFKLRKVGKSGNTGIRELQGSIKERRYGGEKKRAAGVGQLESRLKEIKEGTKKTTVGKVLRLNWGIRETGVIEPRREVLGRGDAVASQFKIEKTKRKAWKRGRERKWRRRRGCPRRGPIRTKNGCIA